MPPRPRTSCISGSIRLFWWEGESPAEPETRSAPQEPHPPNPATQLHGSTGHRDPRLAVAFATLRKLPSEEFPVMFALPIWNLVGKLVLDASALAAAFYLAFLF